MSLAVLALALAGCQPQNAADASGSAVNPPSAVRIAAAEFSGTRPGQIQFASAAGGFAATYRQAGRRFTLTLDPAGKIMQVAETVRYRPYDPTPANLGLAAAASPAENLVEAVIARDRPAQQRALGDLDRALQQLRANVPAPTRTRLSEVLASARAADQAGDRFGVGIAAVSLYRRLEEAQDWRGAPVPLGVALLDHAGFTTDLLLTQPQPDWTAAAATARDASAQLAAIRPSLADANLAAVTGGIVARLQAGVGARDVAGTRSAAQELLAVVDLLEQYYDGAYKVRGA
jgi:hypothetical protein